MALLCNSFSKLLYFQCGYTFSRLTSRLLKKCIHTHDRKDNSVDALEVYTTQLVNDKSFKWEIIKNKKKYVGRSFAKRFDENNVDVYKIKVNIIDFTAAELNETLMDSLESENVEKIVVIANQCVENQRCPSLKVFQKVLLRLAKSGCTGTMNKLIDLLREVDPEELERNSDFQHFIAVGVYVRGNLQGSFNLFETVYKKNVYLRRLIRLMLKYIMLDVVSKQSEASLVVMNNFYERLITEYGDYFPLACMWQACFTSEWHSDQMAALTMIERHKGLVSNIVNRIPIVVGISLSRHQTDVVYRLIEILLKYELKPQYTWVTQTLFDYKCWQRDLRGCSEIIQWALSREILLTSNQHERFIHLLLGRKTTMPTIKPPPPPPLKYKF